MAQLVEEWRENLDESFVVGAVLTDQSKAFDSTAHDPLIAKLTAYGFSDTALRYVYSYLMAISGAPQGSILGLIIFNL